MSRECDMTRIVKMSIWYSAYDTHKCEHSLFWRIVNCQCYALATGLSFSSVHSMALNSAIRLGLLGGTEGADICKSCINGLIHAARSL